MYICILNVVYVYLIRWLEHIRRREALQQNLLAATSPIEGFAAAGTGTTGARAEVLGATAGARSGSGSGGGNGSTHFTVPGST